MEAEIVSIQKQNHLLNNIQQLGEFYLSVPSLFTPFVLVENP